MTRVVLAFLALRTESNRRLDAFLLRSTVEWYLRHPDWLASARSGEYLEYYERHYVRRSESEGKCRHGMDWIMRLMQQPESALRRKALP